MFTFYQFRYDPLSLSCMLNYGIVKVLVEQIKYTLDEEYSASCPHSETENLNIRKRRQSMSPEHKEPMVRLKR